jgi:hypothetical protein
MMASANAMFVREHAERNSLRLGKKGLSRAPSSVNGTGSRVVRIESLP